MVTFDASFVNTSAKTIKYIEFHFEVVLTYMDGSKKILSGKQLYVNRN